MVLVPLLEIGAFGGAAAVAGVQRVGGNQNALADCLGALEPVGPGGLAGCGG